MALQPKVLTNFSKLKNGDLLTKANHIVTSLTGNTNFTTPKPALADVTAAIKAYETALANANDGGKTFVTIKDAARATLENLLNTLALYVGLNSDGDILIMQSSGFDIKKAPAAVGVLAKPGNFSVVSAIKGAATPGIDKVYGANSYQFEYTDAPIAVASIWTVVPSTATSALITGLTSGKEYAFRVAGIGSATTRVYSDVITAFIS